MFYRIVLFCLVQALFLHRISAQQIHLQFTDQLTGEKIESVSYRYGSQKGVSDASGHIVLSFHAHWKLFISHVSYRERTVDAASLHSMLSGATIQLEPATQQLYPVTVYGLKGRHPAKTMRLNHADWVQHDAGQVLQQVPGFSAIRKSGAYGFDPVFRGFKQEQLNIINDGALSALAACPNRMDPPSSQVMISQVQQIEVVKGPHSFRYGPSMGASVNFKSAVPAFTEKPTWFGRINTGFESNGSVYRTEGMAGIRSKTLQVAAAGSFSEGSHYKDGKDSIIPAAFKRAAGGIYLDYRINPKQLLTVSATRNWSRNTSFPTLLMDLLNDDTWMLQAGYKISGKDKWYSQWHTQVYSSFVDHEMGNRLRPSSSSMLSYVHAQTVTSGARTEWSIPLKNSMVYAGADWKYETADGNRTRKMLTGMMAGKMFTDTIWQQSSQSRGGLFADWQFQQGHYKFLFATRLDAVQARAGNTTAFFSKFYGTKNPSDLNFSISAGASRQLGNHWQAGLWLGRGVRSASLTERFINSLPVGLDPYELIGNPYLQPEANNQFDLTLAYKTEKSAIELNAYASLVSNYITSVIRPDLKPRIATAPGVRQYVNTDKATLYGFELNWSQQWISVLRQQATLVYVYGENKQNGNPLPEIAPLDFKYKLEAQVLQQKLQPWALYRYVSQQKRIAPDFGEKTTDAFQTIDLGIKWAPVPAFQFSAAVTNVMNKTYREHLSRFISATQPLNAPGRSFIVGLVYQF